MDANTAALKIARLLEQNGFDVDDPRIANVYYEAEKQS